MIAPSKEYVRGMAQANMPMALFMASSVALSVIFARLSVNTRFSVLPAIVLHWSVNAWTWAIPGRRHGVFETWTNYFKRVSARMIRISVLIFSVIAVLLGGLWLLQGLGVVHLRPILCFADCAPLQGPSATWAVIGAVTLAAGCFGVFWSRKQSSERTQKEIQ